MIEHKAPISGIAASGDMFVATAGYDNQVILWDARRKTPLARSFHDHLANQAAFSACGRYLVTASSDRTARVWNVPEMTLRSVLGHHQDDVEMAVFHPTKALVATASRDHRVRVFTLDGELVRTFEGHTADVISVEWTGDGDQLCSSSDDGTVRRWSLASGKESGAFDMKGVETDTLVMAPDGAIYAGNDDGEIIMILGSLQRTFAAHEAGIKRLVLDPKGRALVSVSYDRTLKVWDLEAGGNPRLRLTTSLPAILWPRSCAFQGADRLVLGTFGSSYAVFDCRTELWNLDGIATTGGVNAVAFTGEDVYAVGDSGTCLKNGRPHLELGSLCNFLTPFGGAVLSGGQMGVVFDAVTGRRLYEHHSPLNCAAVFMRDGKPTAVVGTYTGEGLIFSLDAAGVPALERIVALHANAVKSLACSGDLIFSVSATGAAAFHSTRDLSPVLAVARAHEKIANGCTALPDGRFASVSRDLKLRLWERPQNGRADAKIIDTPHAHSIKCTAASANGLVATGSYGGRVSVYDPRSESWTFDERLTAAGISSLCARGDGFLASSYDGEVYFVEPASGLWGRLAAEAL